MKKFKLLPSLIMLVLCIGVLAVGVYALTPISNTIAGTINISAGKASLAITGYVDGNIVYPRTELHGAMDWTIDSSKINFNASNYCFAEDVPEKEVKLVIENLGNDPLGVFFCDTANVNATESNIKTTGEIKSSTDSTKTILNAELDFYKYIAPANANNTFDQAEMTITLSVASLTSTSQTGSFKYYLNIEEYDPELNATEKFVKIADTETEIAEAQFEENKDIESVVIPTSVKIINDYGFNYCCNLKNIFIPESVTYIGVCAFCCCCTNLTKIIVPNSVQLIYDAFTRCINLEEVIIGAKEMDGATFDDCTNLKEVTITSSVTQIGYGTFSGCTSLKEITIPSSVTQIGPYAFEGCCSLKEITIPSSVTKIGYGAFMSCSSLTQIIIPNSVDEISNATFFGCSSLTELTIPSSVNTICFQAFDGCVSLTKITVEAHGTSGNFDSTASGASPARLPVVSGTAWYIVGRTEAQTKLSYSTSTLVFVRKNV